MRCLVNVLDSKGFDKNTLKEREEDYLEFRNKPKLNALEYDRDYFRDVIIHNKAISPIKFTLIVIKIMLNLNLMKW